MLLAADPMVFTEALHGALARGGGAKGLARWGDRESDGLGLVRCSVTLTREFKKIFHRFNDLENMEGFLC